MSLSKKESQFELFTSDGDQASTQKRGKGIFLSVEVLVLLGIIVFVLLIVSFSAGVKKGKGDVVPEMVSKIAKVSESQNLVDTSKKNDIIPDLKAQKEPESVPQQIVVNIQEEPKEIVIDLTDSFQKSEQSQQVDFVQAKEKSFEDQKKKSSPDAARYTIQVASFKLQKNVEAEIQNLKRRGFEAFSKKKGDYSIVCVGRFETKQEAQKIEKKLKSTYRDCLIRSL